MTAPFTGGNPVVELPCCPPHGVLENHLPPSEPPDGPPVGFFHFDPAHFTSPHFDPAHFT
jgi:hypothetical protein